MIPRLGRGDRLQMGRSIRQYLVIFFCVFAGALVEGNFAQFNDPSTLLHCCPGAVVLLACIHINRHKFACNVGMQFG